MDAGWVLPALQGIGLAAAAGLRTFLPLFVVSLCGRLEWLPLSPRFEWMAETPALIAFGVAVLLEVAADKIPVLDHLLDVLQFWLKPIAGGMLAAAVLLDLEPLSAAVLAIIAGGAVAPLVHLGKAKLRVASTVVTGGVGNPVVSVAEDSVAVSASLAAVFIPWLAIVLVVGVIGFWWRRRRRVYADRRNRTCDRS
jgi:hypothetical protein